MENSLRLFEYLSEIQTLLLGLLIFFVFTWLIKWYHSTSKLPPGPVGWPIIGCIPQILMSGKLLHETIANIGAMYGNVASMYLGRTLVVVLNGYESIREGFQNPCLADRPRSALFERTFQGQGISFGSGQSWKDLRQFSVGILRSFGIGKRSYEDQIIDESQYLLDYITNSQGKPFNPTSVIHNAVTNNICSVVLGDRYEYDDPTYERLLQCLEENTRLSGGSFLLNVLPAASLIFRDTQKKILKNLNEYKRIFQPIIDEHRQNLNPDELNDYISVYLNECATKSAEGQDTNIHEKHLLFIVVQLFAAGTGTVATTLLWAILYMMTYPDIQRRIQEELDSIVGRDRLPKLSDRPNLPYTEATLLEIHRHGSIVPAGVPHLAGSSTTIKGYTIPKGSIVIGNLWSVHYDPNIWKEPSKFDPTRFFEDGHVVQLESMLPFSIGKRVCLGEQFAKMELFIFFTHLLHRFRWCKPKDSANPSLTAGQSAGRSPQPYQVCTEVRN